MTKTKYNKLLKKMSLSAELKIEYDKLISDMKVFLRDSYLIPDTLLSISETEGVDDNIKKLFNIIPNIDEHDMWMQIKCAQINCRKR